MKTSQRRGERGFTIVEVLIAIVVLTVGLLGLVTTAALVTRMIGQGQRSAVAATFAGQRLEILRAGACPPVAQRAAGADTLIRGGAAVAINQWQFTGVPADPNAWKISLSVEYVTVQNRKRTERMETIVIC
ncbi:MAG: type IV pilus modification PilV family protein [Gemmatimonadales bacterium]